MASLLSKIFHGLAGRQTLGGFPGTLMVLNDGLWLMERLVLVLESWGHLVADVWFCSCVSNEGVFGVKVCPTPRQKCCRGFVDFLLEYVEKRQ